MAVAAGLMMLSAGLRPPVAIAADPPPATQPAPGITNEDAIMIFGGALMDCLQSREGGQSIRELGDAIAMKVEPAGAEDRKWAGPITPSDSPVWTTGRLGNLLVISEPSPQRCEFHAPQLPVDRNFQAVIFARAHAVPDLKPVNVDPGFDPIVYQLESVSGGVRYIVHLEGAEPGAPGHDLRFSLLYAYVARQPATTDETIRP